MKTRVKICGLKDPSHVQIAAEAGASYVGFVFFEKSPRNVTVAQAEALAIDVPMGARALPRCVILCGVSTQKCLRSLCTAALTHEGIQL